MLRAVRRWLRRQQPLPPPSPDIEMEVQAQEEDVNEKLADMMAYLDSFTQRRDGRHHEVPS